MTRLLAAIGSAVAVALSAGSALALDEVTFGTNWYAQAEHGGFYQAVADGTYEKHGLKVTIRQGGPQAGNQELLNTGKIDFYIGGNMLEAISAIEQDIPIVVVSAIFQKYPMALLAHPQSGFQRLDDLSSLPTIYMCREGFTTFFQWMKSEFNGFSDAQYKPYNFNPAPFIADPNSAQQGYITSEPYAIERQAGWAPTIFLLADYGFDTYANMIEAHTSLVEENPDLVNRFVEASAIGWYNYLYGDSSAANALIKADNPQMTDGQIAYSIKAMKEYGIVVSGAAESQGIGCMTDAQQKSFFDKMVNAGVVKAGVDYTRSYTTEFVCKGVGAELAQ